MYGYPPYPESEVLYCLLKQRTVTLYPLRMHCHYSETAIAELSKTILQRKHCILNYHQHMLNVLCHLAQQLQFEHKQDVSQCKIAWICYLGEDRIRHRSMKKV